MEQFQCRFAGVSCGIVFYALTTGRLVTKNQTNNAALSSQSGASSRLQGAVNPLRGSAFGLAAFAVFSTQDAVIKSISGHSVFQIAFFAVLFSFVPFTLFLALDGNARSYRPQVPGLTALRCLFTLGSLLSAVYAFSVLPMTEVYSLVFTAPILITLLAIPILGEKIKLIRWIAIGIGLIGVMVVLRPGQSELSSGHLAAILAAVCVACTAVVTRKIGNREHSHTLIVYPLLVNLLVTGACLIFVYQPMDGKTLALMAAIGLLSVLGQSLNIEAYRISEAQFVAPMQYSQMLWAMLFGTILFDEEIDRYVIIGSGIIIFSGLLFLWREMVVSVVKPVLRTRNLRMAAGPQAYPSESDAPQSNPQDGTQ